MLRKQFICIKTHSTLCCPAFRCRLCSTIQSKMQQSFFKNKASYMKSLTRYPILPLSTNTCCIEDHALPYPTHSTVKTLNPPQDQAASSGYPSINSDQSLLAMRKWMHHLTRLSNTHTHSLSCSETVQRPPHVETSNNDSTSISCKQASYIAAQPP